MSEWPADVVTLSIDVGGSGLKGALLDASGKMLTEKHRIETPYPCPPERLVTELVGLAAQMPGYHRVSVGFPGLVRGGRVFNIPSLSRSSLEGDTDPKLAAKWEGFDLTTALNRGFGVPVRVANDADVQGSAVVRGVGFEYVITLGTGVGTAVFFDGHLVPHMELGHAPFRKGDTVEEQIGNAARKRVGNSRWITRVHKAIASYDSYLFFDHLYIGGGNARLLKDELFPPKVSLVSNTAGILGGISIWNRD